MAQFKYIKDLNPVLTAVFLSTTFLTNQKKNPKEFILTAFKTAVIPKSLEHRLTELKSLNSIPL